jgi:hypothetical protein
MEYRRYRYVTDTPNIGPIPIPIQLSVGHYCYWFFRAGDVAPSQQKQLLRQPLSSQSSLSPKDVQHHHASHGLPSPSSSKLRGGEQSSKPHLNKQQNEVVLKKEVLHHVVILSPEV